MNQRRLQRSAFITLFLLLLLAGGCVLWMRSAQQQYVLNRQLIAALVKGDGQQALALVEAGADPNTHFTATPVPSLPELLKQLFHRSPSIANTSHTAFSMACGAFWREDGMDIHVLKNQDEVIKRAQEYIAQPHRPDPTQLLQAMLAHGANVNAPDKNGLPHSFGRPVPIARTLFVCCWNMVPVSMRRMRWVGRR